MSLDHEDRCAETERLDRARVRLVQYRRRLGLPEPDDKTIEAVRELAQMDEIDVQVEPRL